MPPSTSVITPPSMMPYSSPTPAHMCSSARVDREDDGGDHERGGGAACADELDGGQRGDRGAAHAHAEHPNRPSLQRSQDCDSQPILAPVVTMACPWDAP